MSNPSETKRTGKIFAYTKGAGLTPEILEQLTEAGYIPVPVKNFDCIKVIEPMPDAEGSVIFRAAMLAMSGSSDFSDTKKRFANNLVNLVIKEQEKNNQ